MISGLLDNLQVGMRRNAPRTNAQPMSDRAGVPGLLNDRGLPMWQNQARMRSPNYMGLLGHMGQQPYMWGYEGLGNRGPVATPFSLGNSAPLGGQAPAPQSDYLDRILNPPAPAAPQYGDLWSDQPWAQIPNGQLNERYNPQNYVGGWYWDPNEPNQGGK